MTFCPTSLVVLLNEMIKKCLAHKTTDANICSLLTQSETKQKPIACGYRPELHISQQGVIPKFPKKGLNLGVAPFSYFLFKQQQYALRTASGDSVPITVAKDFRQHYGGPHYREVVVPPNVLSTSKSGPDTGI